MSSLKGPDFQGCLSPAECGAEVWGRMRRAAAEREAFPEFWLLQGWVPPLVLTLWLPGTCFFSFYTAPASPGPKHRAGVTIPSTMLSVVRGLRFALLPLILGLSQALLSLGFQKLAEVETVIMHGTAGREERFFCLKHFISDFVCHAKDSIR